MGSGWSRQHASAVPPTPCTPPVKEPPTHGPQPIVAGCPVGTAAATEGGASPRGERFASSIEIRGARWQEMSDEGNIPIPTSGVHHITLIGSNRQDTIDFYSGVLGMPLVLEQPNLDVPEETHLYFDAGDGRLITFFVREGRTTDNTPTPETVGNVHHIAYQVSPEVFQRAEEGLEAAGYPHTGRVDRGFMDSLYFRDPNGSLIELAFYKFTP